MNLILAFALALCTAFPALAQPAYPSKPIRLLIPSSAGGGIDLLARMFAQRLSEQMGLGQIAVACACATSDFRFPEDDSRNLAPKLAKWFDKFNQRPSMRQTAQAETPR